MKKIVLNYAASTGKYTEYQMMLISHGIDIFLSDGQCFLAVIILSFLFHDFKNTLMYLLILSSLRSYTGGYHSTTHIGCFLIFLCAYLVFEGLSYTSCPESIRILFFFLCSFYTIQNAPVEHINNPLTSKERIRNKKRSFILVLILNFLFIILYIQHFMLYRVIIHTLLINVVFMHSLKYSKYWRKSYEV